MKAETRNQIFVNAKKTGLLVKARKNDAMLLDVFFEEEKIYTASLDSIKSFLVGFKKGLRFESSGNLYLDDSYDFPVGAKVKKRLFENGHKVFAQSEAPNGRPESELYCPFCGTASSRDNPSVGVYKDIHLERTVLYCNNCNFQVERATSEQILEICNKLSELSND